MPSVHPAAGQSAPRCQPRVEHTHELREHRISAARPAPGAAASPAREQGLRPAVRRHDRVARRRRHLHGCDCLAGLPAVEFADRTVGRRHRVVGPDPPLRAARRDHVRPVRSAEDHARSPCRPRVCRRAHGSALGRGRPRALARDRDRCRVRGRRSVLRAGVRCDRAGHGSGEPARSGELVEPGDRAHRAAARGPGDRRLRDRGGRGGPGVPPRRRDVRGRRRVAPAHVRQVRARPRRRREPVGAARARGGVPLRPCPAVAVGNAPVRRGRPARIRRPGRGARALRRQERARRRRGRSGLRLCGRRLRRSPRRGR